METIKSFRKILLTLCLIMTGASSVWAGTTFEINGVNYYGDSYTELFGYTRYYYAYVVGYSGSAETLTIPAYVTNGDNTYQVRYVKREDSSSPVDISSVKTLIFEGAITLNGNSTYPTLTCPSLENVIFKAGVPSLTGSFSKYFGTRTGITAYVTGKTDEEIEEMKSNTAVWSDFANIVPYNEAESETVNVYVTVEHTWVKADGATIATQSTTTQSFVKKKHSNFFIQAVESYFTYDLNEVYVNGKNVKDEMTLSDSWYHYSVSNITSDVYIRVIGKKPGLDCWAAATEGATVMIKVNNETAKQINEYNFLKENLVSTDQIEITFTPDEGYELYKFYYGISNIADISLFEPVDQGDGSYKITFTFGTLTSNLGSLAGCNLLLVFRPASSDSGSGTSTSFDLNGDGNVDVSDIDKLIEEINKQ